MNQCPKKLADAVAANNLSLLQIRQAPGLIKTRELYSNLWGTPGPKQSQPDQTMATLHEKDIFLPITPVEVERKLRRIPGSLAAGINGINKATLREKGMSIILAKYFNLLLFNQAYPAAWKQNRTILIPKAGKDTSDIRNW